MRVFSACLVLIVILQTVSTAASPKTLSPEAAALASIEGKLQHIRSNAEKTQPDAGPTKITEQEVNAYFAAGRVALPAGVQSVRFQAEPGVITGTAQVDFDRLRAGQRSSNPLLSVFTGVHDVVVTAHAHGNRGQGLVQVDSVSLDGIEIPQFVLEMFVEKYLHPKYPNIGLDSHFALPDRIDAAVIGLHQVTLTQK